MRTYKVRLIKAWPTVFCYHQRMNIDPKHLDDTVAKIKQLLPENVVDFKSAGEDKIKLILEGLLQKLEMVSREEFDIQSEVLQRTRQRIQQLEQRIELLEKK